MKAIIATAFFVLMLVGCQPHEPEPEGEHLLQGYEDAMDRARDVENDLQESAERQRRAIEEQGGG